MTKRFELVWTDTGEVLHDNETGLNKGIYSPDYRFHVRDMMNELAEENEQLKQQSNSVYEIVKEYVMSHHCISTMRMLKKIEKVIWND